MNPVTNIYTQQYFYFMERNAEINVFCGIFSLPTHGLTEKNSMAYIFEHPVVIM
jgi:hypothetical protein